MAGWIVRLWVLYVPSRDSYTRRCTGRIQNPPFDVVLALNNSKEDDRNGPSTDTEERQVPDRDTRRDRGSTAARVLRRQAHRAPRRPDGQGSRGAGQDLRPDRGRDAALPRGGAPVAREAGVEPGGPATSLVLRTGSTRTISSRFAFLNER